MKNILILILGVAMASGAAFGGDEAGKQGGDDRDEAKGARQASQCTPTGGEEDDKQRVDRRPVAKGPPSGECRHDLESDADSRQRDDVDFGVTEEPEQVLEQERRSA